MNNNFNLAFDLALKHHTDQLYGDRPYICHLNDVAASLEKESSAHKCVAYLHDILEDTDCTAEDLARYFDEDIVDAVIAITKVKGESYQDYIQKVKSNDLALDVKIQDTLCNLNESVKGKQWNRVRKYSKQLFLLVE